VRPNSVEKVAHELKLTTRRVRQLVEIGMPHNARGKYDLYQCVKWYALYLQELLRRKEFAKDKERERLTRIKADLGELELGKARGELIPIALYEELVTGHVMAARQRFLILPSRIAPQLEGEDRATIKAKLDQAVRGALTALSTEEPENGNRRNQPGNAAKGPRKRKAPAKSVGAPAKTHRKRVGRRKKSSAKRHKRASRTVGH